MEILVCTRLERDEQGRLVIAMYYKKSNLYLFLHLPYSFFAKNYFH